ncbi:EpsG family protein, partial [Neobacillus drentensis]
MTIFWFTLSIVFLLCFGARVFSRSRTFVINGTDLFLLEPNKTLTFFSIVVLVLVSGLRNNIG